MFSQSVLTCFYGESGSGKTLYACRLLLDDWLPRNDGVHYSNLPLGVVPENHSTPPEFPGQTFIDRIAGAALRRHGVPLEDTRRRVQLIPEVVLKAWAEGTSGPWDYFSAVDLNGAVLFIDEIHNYCGPGSSKAHVNKWLLFTGDLRHRGAQLVVMSQAEAKIPVELRREAGTRVEVWNAESDRDPFFRIQNADWYELIASVRGAYVSKYCVVERAGGSTGRGKPRDWVKYRVDPYFFQFYDSYSAPAQGGRKGEAQKREYQKRGKLSLLSWFVLKNIDRIWWRVGVACLVFWMLALGGLGQMIRGFLEASAGVAAGSMVSPNAGESASDSSVAPADQGGGVSADGALVAGQVDTAIFEELVTRVRTAEQERDAALSQLTVAKADPSTYCVFLDDSSAVFGDGVRYFVGELVRFGPFEGLRLAAVNVRYRYVLLSDGTQIRLGPPADPVGVSNLLGFAPVQ